MRVLARRCRSRSLLISTFAVLGALALSAPAQASLQLLRPDPSVPATFVGKGGYSSDGLGQFNPGGTIQAAVPAGSTVRYAFLYGTYFSALDPSLEQRTIRVDSTDVVTEKISALPQSCCDLSTTRADVTNLVAAKVGSGGGITDFAINNDPGGLDGVALVVIYSNPALPQTTIAVLDGSADNQGDQATFNFAQPIDKTQPGFNASMALGSGFSFQGGFGPTHDCGGGQFSVVEVNSQLLSGCAGHYDDGDAGNGALITVGGVGDSLDNPTPPNAPPTDDELYDLVPFLQNGDTQLVIDTNNPSNDDNLFLAVIATSAQAAVTLEQCNDDIDNDQDGKIDEADPDCYTITLSPATATNPVGQPHDVEATVGSNANDGNPNGKDVLFKVTGANSANGSDAIASNKAQFQYTGTNAGTDTIEACFDLDDDGSCDADEPKATASKTYEGDQPPGVDGRMVSNATREGTKYASIVDCITATANARNRPFTVQWKQGGVTRTFKATPGTYADVLCFDDAGVAGAPNGFDTQTGKVNGTINGLAGTYQLSWKLVDGGDPASDRGQLTIRRVSDGTVVRSVSEGAPTGSGHFALAPS